MTKLVKRQIRSLISRFFVCPNLLFVDSIISFLPKLKTKKKKKMSLNVINSNTCCSRGFFAGPTIYGPKIQQFICLYRGQWCREHQVNHETVLLYFDFFLKKILRARNHWYFISYQTKHMLWVLKWTVSMRRFVWEAKTNVKTDRWEKRTLLRFVFV